MLRIWGRISSINVQKVVWCAGELGCEFERIDAGGAFGVVDTPAYGRLNPNRKVPVIEDDGFVLWESNAIVRYLCARYAGEPSFGRPGGGATKAPLALRAVPPSGSEPSFGRPGGGLMPASLAARAECDRWMDWQATEFSPMLRDAFLQLIRTPPEQRQPAVIEESVRRCEPLLAILDEALADRAFLVGDGFTMADIPIGCTVHRWLALPIERIARPNVDKWFERVRNRAAAQAVLALPLS